MIWYAVRSNRQKAMEKGSFFVTKTLDRAVNYAVRKARERKQKMHVVIIRR